MPDYKTILAVRPLDGKDFKFLNENVSLFWRFEAEGIYNAITGFLHRSSSIYRRQFAMLRDQSADALGVLLHNYLVRKDPGGLEYPRAQTMQELLLTFAERKTSTIFIKTVDLAAELFGYYAAFDSKEADEVADLIVGGGHTPNGNLLIQALLAPAQKSPSANHRACLYTKLYEAIARKGDVSEWLKANVAQKHMPAAVSATEWVELLPIMNNKAKGKTLEDSLGL